MIEKNDKPIDKMIIQELLDIWHENDRKRREKDRELIEDLSKIMILNQVEEIVDRQEEAYERRMKSHRNYLKNLGGNQGKGKII